VPIHHPTIRQTRDWSTSKPIATIHTELTTHHRSSKGVGESPTGGGGGAGAIVDGNSTLNIATQGAGGKGG
jgi:hypothetical protein